MVSPVYTPIHIMNVRKPDYDISSLGEGLQSIRNAYDKRLEREERAAAQQQAQRAAAAKADQDRVDGARNYVSNIMTTLDPNAPDFATQWGGHLTKLRQQGHDIGPEYDDPKFGYSLALAEVTDAKTRHGMMDKDREFRLKERELAAKGDGGAEAVSDEDPRNYGIDDDGNIIRVVDQVAGVGSTTGDRTSYGTPGGARFGEAGRESMNVPGIVVEKGKAAPQWVTREAEGQEATSRAPEEQQARVQRLQDVQRMWTRTYGRPPPSGHVYAEDGSLIDLKQSSPRGRSTSRTQDAAAASTKAAREIIEISREALDQTNFVTRGLSSGLRTGTQSRVEGLLEPAVRALMHGISGAQVNIPETESYMRSFMPHWSDSKETRDLKLNHMDMILTQVEAVLAGKGANDPQTQRRVNEISNEMRRALRLQTKGQLDQLNASEEQSGVQGMSDDDLLRALEQ